MLRASKLLLHLEGGIKRALRMILMRNWCTEQRKDPIAGRLHDIAVVAMDGVDHKFQRGIDNRPGLFGVQVLCRAPADADG